MDAALARGGEVWVKAGIYVERVNLRPYVNLYGGFAGTEEARDSRNWTANPTVLDGSKGGSVITGPLFLTGGPSISTIDGFTIQNGQASDGGGYILSPMTACNNMITGNSATYYGGGICCWADLTATGNTVTNNTAANGGGIFGGGVISDNTISNNQAVSGDGGGISPEQGCIVERNFISGNTAKGYGGGMVGDYDRS